MSYANTATKNIYFDDENNEADDTYDAVDASDDVGDDGDDKNAASQLRLSLENKTLVMTESLVNIHQMTAKE